MAHRTSLPKTQGFQYMYEENQRGLRRHIPYSIPRVQNKESILVNSVVTHDTGVGWLDFTVKIVDDLRLDKSNRQGKRRDLGTDREGE